MTPSTPHRLVILLCLSFIATSVFSQYKEGFKLLEAGKINQAYGVFNKTYQDEVNKTCSQYGLAQIYSDSNFSKFDILEAYNQIKTAEKSFRKLDYKSRKKLVKLINSTEIRVWKKKIVEIAYTETEKENTLAAFNGFLNDYDRPSYKIKTKAIKARNKLAFADAQDKNTVAVWQNFLKRYKTDLKNQNPGLYKRGEKHLFEAYVKENSWERFDSFAVQFPTNPYTLDAGASDFIAICGTSDRASFQDFSKKHPESLFAAMSKDSINALKIVEVRLASNPQEIFDFIEESGIEEYDRSLDLRLSELFRQEPILHYYLNKVPAEKFEELLPLTTQAIFKEYAIWGQLVELETFQTQFPNFSDTIQLKNELELAAKYKELPAEYSTGYEANFRTFIQEAAPRNSAYQALQTMLKPDIDNGNIEEALSLVREFQPLFGGGNYWLKNIETALLNEDETAQRQNLSDSVNTKAFAEYLPVLSADGQTLYFCGYKRKDNIGGEDIFVSKKINGQWTSASPIKELCDTYNNEAPFAVSTDGTRIFVFISGDMFYHDLTAAGWSPKQALTNVNTSNWECDVNLSSDGKVMFFTSLRDNIIGPNRSRSNIDIFVSLKDDKGQWGEAFNIGSALNTPFIDRTPFLHPDMKTLYFSSQGHGSIGGIDVFMTTRLDDSWKNWSQPVNLGKMINTTGRDWGYKISTDGETAYFAGGKAGAEDIFRVGLPEEFRPDDVSTISGTLSDNDGKPISADIVVKDLETDEIVGVFKSNPMTGDYFFTLPQDKLYGYHIKKEGHYPISDNLDLRNVEEGEDVKQDLTIVSMEELVARDIALPLVNLFFDTDKHELKEESFAELNRLASIMKANDYSLEVLGHTDDVGSTAYNLNLSQKRANAVREYLVKKGCEKDKIKATGFGESKPDDSNQTIKGRAQNRRVEVRFKE